MRDKTNPYGGGRPITPTPTVPTQPATPPLRPALGPEALARAFHETYERLAPDFGYRTREASAKPWAEVPEANKGLMIAVCREILTGPLADATPAPPVEEPAPAGVTLGDVVMTNPPLSDNHPCGCLVRKSGTHRNGCRATNKPQVSPPAPTSGKGESRG